MKLRDLARGSSDPTSFLPAFHILRYRFGNREAFRFSRKSYESVPISPCTPPLLTLLQRTTMVPVPGVLRHPRHPESPVTFPIWTYHGDRNFCRRTCRGPTSFLHFLILEQSRRRTYHEVLVTGDLSEEELQWMTPAKFLYRGGTPDIAELVYNNDTVYFAQPSPSQFVLGGSAFNRPAPTGPKVPPNDTLVLMDRDAPKSDISAVIRYAPPVRWRCSLTPRCSPSLDTPSGESGFTARSYPTLKLICEATQTP